MTTTGDAKIFYFDWSILLFVHVPVNLVQQLKKNFKKIKFAFVIIICLTKTPRH